MPYGSKTGIGGVLGRGNSPTWTAVRRIPLPAGFLPARTPYPSVASDPAGGILRSNAIACVSSMSASSDMCGRSWRYTIRFHEPGERIRLHCGRADRAGGARRPGHVKERGSMRRISPRMRSSLPLVRGWPALASVCRMPRSFRYLSNSDTPLLFFSDSGGAERGSAVGQYRLWLAIFRYGPVQHIYGVPGGRLV